MNKYQKIKLVMFFVFGTLLAFVFYNFSEKNRYVFSNERHSVLDTRTGKIYYPNRKIYIEIKDYKEGDFSSRNSLEIHSGY